MPTLPLDEFLFRCIKKLIKLKGRMLDRITVNFMLKARCTLQLFTWSVLSSFIKSVGMAKKTKLNKAIDAAKECAHSKDLLNCQLCIQSFANDHSCLLSENVRVESIKTIERWLRSVERIVREREMLDYSSDIMWLPLGSRRSLRPVNLDEFIIWARKQIADLDFYDITRSVEP